MRTPKLPNPRKARWIFFLLPLATCPKLVAAAAYWEPLGPFGGWVTTVAVDPFRPQVIFVGTHAGGLFKSVDRGSSWKASSLGLAHGLVERLAFDPESPGVVYAATSLGLFKSADGGNTWYAIGEGMGRPSVKVVAVNPWESSHLLAGSDKGLFWSSDAGVSWLWVPGWPFRWIVQELTFAPLDPRVVYAASWSEVMKSVDGGWSWYPTGLQGVFISSLAVDPRNPDVVYAGSYQGVRKSTDGGRTWFLASDGLYLEPVWCLAQSPKRPDTLYAGTGRGVYKTENAGGYWQRANLGMQGARVTALAVDPLQVDTVYAGTDTEVYRSTNGGRSWERVVKGLSATTVTAFAVVPQNSRVLYCVSSDSLRSKHTIWKTSNRGATWTQLRSLEGQRDILDVLVDPANSSVAYVAVKGLGVLKTQDGGSSWSLKTPQELTFLTAVALDPQNGAKLYAARGSYVFCSVDGGDTWALLSQIPLDREEDDPWEPELRLLAVHPQWPEVLFAGASNGQFFKSVNGGQTWLASLLPPERVVATSLAVSFTDPQRLYLGTNGGLCVSTDGGASCTFVPGLKTTPISSLTLAGDQQEVLVVGTRWHGVVASFDGGQTWVDSNVGLPCTTVTKLRTDPQNPRAVFAATDGCGLVTLTLQFSPRWVLQPQGRSRGR